MKLCVRWLSCLPACRGGEPPYGPDEPPRSANAPTSETEPSIRSLLGVAYRTADAASVVVDAVETAAMDPKLAHLDDLMK